LRSKATTILAVTAVLAIVAIGVGAPVPVSACSKKDASASSVDEASCKEAASKAAAAVTVDAHDCCKTAVATALEACTTKNASYTTAGKSACSSSSAKAAESKTALAPCCEKTVAAFQTACAQNIAAYTNAKVADAGAYSCTKDAGATASTKVASGYSSCTKSAQTSSLAAITYDEGKRVELTGSVVCGHCDLEYVDNCQAVFKTAYGKAYLLIESDMVEKMREKKTDNGYKIVTVVRSVDGTKYLDVEKMSAL